MGKRRSKEGDEGGSGSPKKKHKKNKHKRHHYVISEDPEGSASPSSSSSFHRPITLKIKLGDRLISSSSTGDIPADDTSSIAESEPQSLVAGGSSSVGGVEEEWEGSDISIAQNVSEEEEEEEEEAWLDALEAGQVNERGYLPQKKDNSSLTARQRAMLGEAGGDDAQLMELPLGSKTAAGDDEMTEEMMLKKTEKNRKRRLAAQKRKEKRKAETVRKLLEKQSTKKRDDDMVTAPPKPTLPHMRYVSTTRGVADGCGSETTLSLPSGMEFPLQVQNSIRPRPPVQCAAEGCTNVKKYSDAVTKLPLCSLTCYKKLRLSSLDQRGVEETAAAMSVSELETSIHPLTTY